MAVEDIKKNGMMAHLVDALDRGEDIGHYGRLVFAMVGRYFLTDDEIVGFLQKDRDCDEAKAKALLDQVNARDYNPPTRQRILEWMGKQGFPICPDPEDPDGCNLYRDLDFPERVYRSISGYREQKTQAEAG